jgi:hypothetical protein
VALLTSLNIVTHSNLSITMDLVRFLTLLPMPKAHGDIVIEKIRTVVPKKLLKICEIGGICDSNSLRVSTGGD